LDGAPHGRLVALLRALAALSIVVSFASLWLSERTRVLDDLQLATEATARPGETIALRAFYLRDVEAARGPELARTDVRVRLLDSHEREVGRTTLTPGRADPSMEGRLQLPWAAHGALTLEARAQLRDRAPIVCRRAIDVRKDAPTLVPRSREAAPLSLFSLGALRPAAPDGAPGLRLEPRVVGGACVPEQPCRMLVFMGARAALSLRLDPALSLLSTAPTGETDGIVQVSLRVLGPEASLELEALRDGKRVAQRSLRLPVALGEARLDTTRALLDPDEDLGLSVVLPPGRSRGIVDLFAAGRWSASMSFLGARAGALAEVPLPAGFGTSGLLRIQAHADRFGGEGAGARLVYRRAPGETTAHALAAIGRAARAGGFETAPLAAEGEPPPGNGELAAQFVLASLEGMRVPLPRAVSGRPLELARLSRAQAALRFGVGGMLTLSALVVGLTLMRRGFSAQAEARAILDSAADELGESRNSEPSRGVLVVICLGLAVSLAFVLAALLIVAKPLWF
jgi:hypothetical protein